LTWEKKRKASYKELEFQKKNDVPGGKGHKLVACREQGASTGKLLTKRENGEEKEV